METYHKHFARLFCALAIVCVGTVNGYFEGYDLTIGNPAGEAEDRYSKVAPYFLATMDAAGYSDWKSLRFVRRAHRRG